MAALSLVNPNESTPAWKYLTEHKCYSSFYPLIYTQKRMNREQEKHHKLNHRLKTIMWPTEEKEGNHMKAGGKKISFKLIFDSNPASSPPVLVSLFLSSSH